MVSVIFAILILFFGYIFQLFFIPFFGIQMIFPDNIALGRFLGHIVRLALFLLLYYFYRKRTTRYSPNLSITWTDVILLTIFSYTLETIISFSFPLLFPPDGNVGSQLSSSFVGNQGFNTEFLIILFSALIVAPIVEEIFFRWLYCKIMDHFSFGKFDYSLKFGLNTGIFAGYHIVFADYTSFFNTWHFYALPTWIFSSIVIYWLYMKSKRLDYVIVFHSLGNLIPSIYNAYYLYTGSYVRMEIILITWIPLAFIIGYRYRKTIRKILTEFYKEYLNFNLILFTISLLFGLIIITQITRTLYGFNFSNQSNPVMLSGIVFFLIFYFSLLSRYFSQSRASRN